MWESAVRSYRQSATAADIAANYFDLPLETAARRFAASEEFAEVRRLLGPAATRSILDVGAGQGVSSFAFASAGWRVTALEPDPSCEVGSAAIHTLAKVAAESIAVVRSIGEAMPFRGGSFDAAYCRQVLHHSRALPKLLTELARVLKPGAPLLTVRDHVADNDLQREQFLDAHPLHAAYGGEWAYSIEEYLEAATGAGFALERSWGPEQSILNFYPGTGAQLAERQRQVATLTWQPFGRWLAGLAGFRSFAVARAQARHRQPGRLYSFLFRNR